MLDFDREDDSSFDNPAGSQEEESSAESPSSFVAYNRDE